MATDRSGKTALLVAGAVATIVLVGCSSSGAPAATRASSAPLARSSGATASETTSSAGASTVDEARSRLPQPCHLLSRGEMTPLFGATARLDAIPTAGPAAGTAQCAFERARGPQGDGVNVWTRANYAVDRSYVFPSVGRSIAGIGQFAVISPELAHRAEITVKLGANAIEIDIEFGNGPADDHLLVDLAKDAVSRV